MLKNSVGRAGRQPWATTLIVLACLAIAAPEAQNKSAAPKVTTPKEQFGHDIGDDYFLVNYTKYVEYLKKLDAQSDRMTVVEIGKTEGCAVFQPCRFDCRSSAPVDDYTHTDDVGLRLAQCLDSGEWR